MNTITVQEIERDPVAFVPRMEAGEVPLIVQGERALAEVHPLPTPVPEPRPYGLCAGEFRVPADSDEPLLEDVLQIFAGR